MRTSLLVAGLLLVATAPACNDDTCSISEVAVQAVQDSVATSDWRERLSGFVASAPADSVMRLTVFLDHYGDQELVDWAAQEPGVVVLYHFKAFSGFAIDVPVRALPGLLPQEAITGVFWGDTGFTYGDGC
jgi:hypothetical protein